MVSEKKIFEVFPFKRLWEVTCNEPQGVANLDPRGMVGKIYVGDHLLLLHT